jgi:hypothetical protein
LRYECGDPRINGKRGHIYAVPEGFQLYYVCESRKAWTYAKRALSFARVTQDGDEEGMLIMDRLPTAEEAEAIRSYLGINKEREYDDETLARLREKGWQWGDERRKNPPSLGTDGVNAYAEVNPDYTQRPDPSELHPVIDKLRMTAVA